MLEFQGWRSLKSCAKRENNSSLPPTGRDMQLTGEVRRLEVFSIKENNRNGFDVINKFTRHSSWLCTFQPLDFRLDWNDSLKREHSQLKTGPGQGLYEELHRVIKRQLIVESSHTLVIKEGWLLFIRHPGKLQLRLLEEMVKMGNRAKICKGGTGADHGHRNFQTSCRAATAVRRNTSKISVFLEFPTILNSTYSICLQLFAVEDTGHEGDCRRCLIKHSAAHWSQWPKFKQVSCTTGQLTTTWQPLLCMESRFSNHGCPEVTSYSNANMKSDTSLC